MLTITWTVLPFITLFTAVKYIALVNRLKIYHLYGTGVVVPSSGVLELLNIVSDNTFLVSSYIGITGAVVLTLGKRIDRIVSVDDWIPLLEMEPRKTDILFLSPQLRDGTKYKLFAKFGVVKNVSKMGQVLE
ncbi:jg8545 [Pararge aegeria aegeria]|uniref:Jg8545 protein n=1 Tax=Pararge aegeria aegeria TaxID=348720 RepID=A0A8S4RHQ5_9NEOP|nr:jg8545 [Pararge aegeria aegeria]